MTNVGKIFRDVTVTDEARMYAVGRTGFIDLTSGDFIKYDSAFSDETFDHEAFFEVDVKEYSR